MVFTEDDVSTWVLPPGTPVVPEWRKRRDAKRARHFVMIEWGTLATDMHTLGMDRTSRLYLVLHLRARLRTTRTRDGWIELVRHELAAAGLADGNLSRDVATLEAAGLVEVRRRSGKRPLLRLAGPKCGHDGEPG